MNYFELIKQYPTFIYHGFEVEETDHDFKITYDFETVGLQRFNPTFTLPKQGNKLFKDRKVVKELVFALGMVEVASYWKCTCSPRIIVECNSLSADQIAWWKKLYFHGLGEFFYINHIDVKQDEFVQIQCVGDAIVGDDLQQEYHGQIIPVGGGKDSFVSLAVLANEEDNHTYIVNSVMSAIHASEAAGYKDRLLYVTRTLDKKMLELNQQGFLNGHTPFSAMVAFSSVLTAVLNQKKYICLSNESSANESTVVNDTVNHQYSKSFEFEQDFHYYCNQYILKEVHYFSLLRPLSELQIAKIFSTLTPYHTVFKSCNVGSKQEIWCNHCAKCLFVYIMLSAYLSDDQCIAIFGENLMDKESLLPIFKELCGLSENKPFECVGTREEVQIALSLAIMQRESNHQNLSTLFSYYESLGLVNRQLDLIDVKNEWNNEHLVPAEFVQLLKEKLEECF